jgi:nucleoid-associated protein YgaU
MLADGAPGQAEQVIPAPPGHPVMVVARMGVPGEIGVPAGVGADGSALQVAYVVPVRPGHPQMDAARMGVPGGLGVPVGAGAGGASLLGAQLEPPRPLHPEAPGALMMAALAEPASPAGAGGADAVRDRAGMVPPMAPPHPQIDWSVPASLTQPSPAGAVGPTVIQGPTDADFDRVRVLIARAEEVDADFYDPQNLNAAREALALAERIRTADPGGSHVALAVAEANAIAAFENTVRLTAERLRKLLAERLEELREIQADLWVPVSFQEMVDAVQRVEEMFAAGDLMGAYRLALATADDMLALRDSLLDRLELLSGKRTETERCLAAAQKLDTSDWTASRLAELRSLYEQLNALYLTGLEAMQSYRLADAEEAFGAAVEVCRRLMAVADDAYMDQMERAAALMKAVMEEIEAASRLHVVTELGDVIRPQPWSGQAVLDELRAGPAQRNAMLDGIDREGQNDLQKAQGLWIEGVVEFDDQKYGQSIRLFEDARRYLDLYKFYAVLGIHVVQLIPERRESLWRIAEYPRWYEDPFLWPRIWRRNRDLIQNPDLIYPGWQLIIPAL